MVLPLTVNTENYVLLSGWNALVCYMTLLDMIPISLTATMTRQAIDTLICLLELLTHEIENRIISLIKPVTIEGVAVLEPGLENEQFNIENMEIVTLDNIDIDENISAVNEPQTPKLTKNKKTHSRAAWHTQKYNADIKALATSNNNVARALNNVARAILMYSRSTR
ncbi:hypothetical protein CBL_20424 [Carabus blaptoides fortunei]